MDKSKYLQLLINEASKQILNEIYNKSDKDVTRYIKAKNPSQKNFGSKDYAKMRRDMESDINNWGFSKDDAFKRFKEKFGKIDFDRVGPIQDEITQELQDKYQAKSLPLEKLTNIEGVDWFSPKDADFIYDDLYNKKGYAYIKPGDIDITCKGAVFTYGNTKLPFSTLIFNMTSAKNCPSTECHLKKICYAAKINNRYKNTFLRDLHNQIMLNKVSASSFLKLINAYIEYAPVRIKCIRLSEAGDFISQENVNIANRFAKILWHRYRIKVVLYTARAFDFSKCDYLIVNASNLKVISPTRYYFAKPDNWFINNNINMESGKIQERVNAKGETEKYFFCHCDCFKCNFCYNTIQENNEDPNLKTKVYCKIH